MFDLSQGTDWVVSRGGGGSVAAGGGRLAAGGGR